MVTTAMVSVALWVAAAFVAAGCGMWLRDQRNKLHERLWVRTGTRPAPETDLGWVTDTFTTLPEDAVFTDVSVGSRGTVQLITFCVGQTKVPYPVGQGRFVVLASIPNQPCGRIVADGYGRGSAPLPDNKLQAAVSQLARRFSKIGAGSRMKRLPSVPPMTTGTSLDRYWNLWAQNQDAAARMVTHPQIMTVLERSGPAAVAGGYTLEVTDTWVCASCDWEDADPTVADEGHGVAVTECAVAFATTLHGILHRG